ncbi:microtubule-associated protein RP/EB family member 3 isoform X4 [Poecile atricapillus]|uniref:microtubule-associated protein RP/EB family member 3 isoform X4 n=1 Tax=Poecile atricapillus TaxID=48891 RepID=UPI0027384591|nr:microtubule-associated protein RP/EB family member 3 isoform X4 [Poecile atricapillus]
MAARRRRCHRYSGVTGKVTDAGWGRGPSPRSPAIPGISNPISCRGSSLPPRSGTQSGSDTPHGDWGAGDVADPYGASRHGCGDTLGTALPRGMSQARCPGRGCERVPHPARLCQLGSSRGINISGAGGRAPLCTCSRRCTELFRLAGAERAGGFGRSGTRSAPRASPPGAASSRCVNGRFASPRAGTGAAAGKRGRVLGPEPSGRGGCAVGPGPDDLCVRPGSAAGRARTHARGFGHRRAVISSSWPDN